VVNATFFVILNVIAKIILKGLLFRCLYLLLAGQTDPHLSNICHLDLSIEKFSALQSLGNTKDSILIFNINDIQHNGYQDQGAFMVNATFLVLLNVNTKNIFKRLLFQMPIIVAGRTDRSPFIKYLPLEYINRKNLSFSVLETLNT
jgi:hypothetical protein